MSLKKDLLIAVVVALSIHVGVAATEIPAAHPAREFAADDNRYLRISFVTPRKEVTKAATVRPVLKKKKIQKSPKPVPIEKKDVVLKNEIDETKPAEPEAVAKIVSIQDDASPVESEETQEIPVVSAVPRYGDNPPPVYPRIAKNRGYEGIVLLSVKVLDNGNVGEVMVKETSGYPILDRAAGQAVEKWQFQPASRRGVPCVMWVDVPVHFVIKESD